MRVTILGSGTLLPDDDHRSAAHLVEDGGRRLLLDCGPGTVHGFARHGVRWRELDLVAVSHFHTDHVGDLPGLLWALRHGAGGREAPLTLVGPPGMRAFLEALASAFGPHVLDPSFPLEVVEISRRGEWILPDGSGRLRAHPVPHTDEAVAWRWSGNEAEVGYTGDTGEDPALGPFFRGVQVLIAECALPDGKEPEAHLTPGSVARLAREVAPEVLVLTHLYPDVPADDLPDLLSSSGYTGEIVVGRDGLLVEGRPGAWTIRGPHRESNREG